jgi:hypothetical protein
MVAKMSAHIMYFFTKLFNYQLVLTMNGSVKCKHMDVNSNFYRVSGDFMSITQDLIPEAILG